MNYTCHSETGKIKSVYIKRADQAFVNDDSISKSWKNLNWLNAPAFEKSLKEYRSFESFLTPEISGIDFLPENESVNIDSIYCRDASIATNGGMIICQMGKTARANEPLAQKREFEKNGIRILGSIRSPGTLEGGDVAWLDENKLAVAHGYRTNEEGIRQLGVLLGPLGVDLVVVPLPHYRGPEDVFHLMSIFSPVDDRLAVVYSPLMPIVFRNFLLGLGYELLEVSDAEFESMGCNVLALAPRKCLMVEGNPKTRSLLEKAGCQVFEYPGNEISIKGGGGPTCLTRPIQRFV